MKQGAESVAASALSGGLGGISKALDTISKADLPGIGNVLDVDIGPSASSFKAITASFGKLEANMPQDLTAIAGAAAAKVAGASAGSKPRIDYRCISINSGSRFSRWRT